MKDRDLLIKLFSGGRKSEKAWTAFLQQYTKLILKIIWKFNSDYDQVMNKYLYVCTRLCCDDFKLLHKYKPCSSNHPPKFSCWLAKVVRNLCIDEHRKTFGRKCLPKALLNMDSFEKKVFNLYYGLGYCIHEIENILLAESNGHYSIRQIIANFEDARSEKKRTYSFFRGNAVSLVEFNDGIAYKAYQDKFIDEASELQEDIEYHISTLPPLNRVLVHLKYWEGLTGNEIAERIHLSRRKVYSIISNSIKILKNRVVY